MLINCNIASSDTLWVTCNATQPAYLQLKDILMLQMFALRAILYAVQALQADAGSLCNSGGKFKEHAASVLGIHAASFWARCTGKQIQDTCLP